MADLMLGFLRCERGLVEISSIISIEIIELFDQDTKHNCFCIVVEMTNGKNIVYQKFESLRSARKGLEDMQEKLIKALKDYNARHAHIAKERNVGSPPGPE